jgi:hypothetical protein
VTETAPNVDVQLYPDGGFQPSRSSLNDNNVFDGSDQALAFHSDV